MCTRATCAALKAYLFYILIYFSWIENNKSYLFFCFYRKAAAMVDTAVLEVLEAGFSKLQASDSKSLLKKYLTREIFDNLKNKKTSFGSTLLDVIQSGKSYNIIQLIS